VARVISRRDWGAKPPKSKKVAKWRKGGPFWVHHTEGAEPSAQASLASESMVMRGLQSFHQNTRGWADIGYSYVIMPSGRIYEGRGYGVTGAHCPGHNNEPSVAFAGSYVKHAPTPAGMDSLGWLKGHVKAGSYFGHRDGFSTSCPGDALYNAIKARPPKAQPVHPAKAKLSLYQRLRKAGLGSKSAKKVLASLRGGK
jgi:hypothetical protein